MANIFVKVPGFGPRKGVNFDGFHWRFWFLVDPVKVTVPNEDHLGRAGGGFPFGFSFAPVGADWVIVGDVRA